MGGDYMSNSELEKLIDEGESLSKEYAEQYRKKVAYLNPKLEKIKDILRGVPDSKYYIYRNFSDKGKPFLSWNGTDLFIENNQNDKKYEISETKDIPVLFLYQIEEMAAKLLYSLNNTLKYNIETYNKKTT